MASYEVVQIGSIGARADAELARRYGVLSLVDKDIPGNLRDRASKAKVLVTTVRRGVTHELMTQLPALGAICSWGVGYDTLEISAARKMGVAVSTTPGILDDCVADLAWALLLSAARRIAAADHYVKGGRWRTLGAFPEAIRVSGKRLGILGMGRIGEAIARRGSGFDMPVGYHNRHAKTGAPGVFFGDLVELAEWADVLVAACPGGDETHHLVDGKVLRALGPEGIFVNVARGSVVDQNALTAAVSEGALGGVGLDVLEREPADPVALKDRDEVVLTPHIGSCTRETRKAMGDLVVANVEAYLTRGKLLTPVS